MKTAKVELSCHMNTDLQTGINGTEIENEVLKKNIILFKKFSLKNLYFTKNSLLKNLYFRKSLLGGLDTSLGWGKEVVRFW